MLSMSLPYIVHRSLRHPPLYNSLLASIRRSKRFGGSPTSSLASGRDVVQTGQETSLAWAQIHDESPASYGIVGWGGYIEMVPYKARLPCENFVTLENAVDYARRGSFAVYYRHSVMGPLIELAKAELKDIRIAKKGLTIIKASMRIEKDLSGTFKAQDTYTKSIASTVFSAGAALRTLKGHDLIKRVE